MQVAPSGVRQNTNRFVMMGFTMMFRMVSTFQMPFLVVCSRTSGGWVTRCQVLTLLLNNPYEGLQVDHGSRVSAQRFFTRLSLLGLLGSRT